jgi:hypothetical protein
MPLGASNTYGMYENLASRGGYRGPLHDLLTAEGANFDFVGLDSDGDLPDPDHNGYPGRSIEWFTRPVNKTAEEDRDVRWAIYSGNTPVVIHFIEQAQMTSEDVILLLVGTNNVRLGQAAETIIREIDVLLEQIVTSEASPAVLLMKLTPVTNDDWPDDDETRTNNDTINLFNEGLERLVAETYGVQGVTLVDSATASEDRSPDGVHLNEAGYRKVAEAFFEGLMASELVERVPDQTTEASSATAANGP